MTGQGYVSAAVIVANLDRARVCQCSGNLDIFLCELCDNVSIVGSDAKIKEALCAYYSRQVVS